MNTHLIIIILLTIFHQTSSALSESEIGQFVQAKNVLDKTPSHADMSETLKKEIHLLENKNKELELIQSNLQQKITQIQNIITERDIKSTQQQAQIKLLRLKIAIGEYKTNSNLFWNFTPITCIIFFIVLIVLSWKLDKTNDEFNNKKTDLREIENKIRLFEEKYQKRKNEISQNLTDLENLKQEKCQELERLSKVLDDMKEKYEEMSEEFSQRKKLDDEVSQSILDNIEIMKKEIEIAECEKWENFKNVSEQISVDEILDLCKKTRQIIEREPLLIHTTLPVSTIGDIHGNLMDLKTVLSKNGIPTKCKLLFLGDYVDRGLESVEVIVCLFRLKILYPEHVILLRGNHEDSSQNCMEYTSKYLLGDCKKKFPGNRFLEIYESINDVFEVLPLAAIIENKIFCCHGGIGPGMDDVSEINNFPRIRSLSSDNSSSAHFNLLWADPNEEDGFGRSSRTHDENCSVRTWGKRISEEFLTRNSLRIIVRAHELCKNGIEVHHDGKVITVFSSSYYCGSSNIGSFLRWNSAEFSEATIFKLRNI